MVGAGVGAVFGAVVTIGAGVSTRVGYFCNYAYPSPPFLSPSLPHSLPQADQLSKNLLYETESKTSCQYMCPPVTIETRMKWRIPSNEVENITSLAMQYYML